MNIDEELGRLFADDRLDIPVRPGAEHAIVAGARRVRRHRAVATAASVVAVALVLGSGIALAAGGDRQTLPPAESTTTTPSTTTGEAPTSTTSPPRSKAKPSTRTAAAPPAAGTEEPTRKPAPPPPPGRFDLLLPTSYGPLALGMSEEEALATGMLGAVEATDGDTCTRYPGTFGGNVLVSANHGVVRVSVTSPVSTPEGIHQGSAVADIRAAYPTATDYRMGLTAGTFSFIIGGPGDYYEQWPDDGPVVRIDITTTSDCALAI